MLKALKDSAANQEILVYQGPTDLLEKKEKRVLQDLRDLLDQSVTRDLRVLLELREGKDREACLEKGGLMVQKDHLVYLGIRVLLVHLENVECLVPKEPLVK